MILTTLKQSRHLSQQNKGKRIGLKWRAEVSILLGVNETRFEKLLCIELSEEAMMDDDVISYEGGEKLPNPVN